MAEILDFNSFIEDESMDNIDDYMKMYDDYSNSIEAAKELFSMLHSVFCQICSEANIEPSIFKLSHEEADVLFTRTLQWMFPLPYETPDDDDFRLVWKGSDDNYKYSIDVVTPSERAEYGDDTPILSRTLRTDLSGFTEFWNPEQNIWEEYTDGI